jgi:hypothetical protein
MKMGEYQRGTDEFSKFIPNRKEAAWRINYVA